MWLYLDETAQQTDVTDLPGDDVAVTSPERPDSQRGSPRVVPESPSQEHERERRRPEILDEDLNDDDVTVDDRLDVASLGDSSDDEVIKSEDEDDYAGSPFARDVIIPPGNAPNDGIQEQVDSRSPLFDDQVGSLNFTNQVCASAELRFESFLVKENCVKILFCCIGLSRYIAVTNLPIIAVFVEYLCQFLIDLHQIYRHSSVPKTRLREFFELLNSSGFRARRRRDFFCHVVCVTV